MILRWTPKSKISGHSSMVWLKIKNSKIVQWFNTIQWYEKQNTEKFYNEVNLYRNSAGKNSNRILCLPDSNADIERVFSQIKLVKNRIRNRMLLPHLNSILFIRFGLKFFVLLIKLFYLCLLKYIFFVNFFCYIFCSYTHSVFNKLFLFF